MKPDLIRVEQDPAFLVVRILKSESQQFYSSLASAMG